MSAKQGKRTLKKEIVQTAVVRVNSMMKCCGSFIFDVTIDGKNILLSNDEFKLLYTRDYACYLASLVQFKK